MPSRTCGLETTAAVPELAALLAAAAPICCTKLRLASRSLASAFGDASVDEAARHELVAGVLAEPCPGLYAMQTARLALAHPRLESSAASALLVHLRGWLPILCPPTDNVPQRTAVDAGLAAIVVQAIDRYADHMQVLAALCEVMRRCCVHNARGAEAALNAGAVPAMLKLLCNEPPDERVRCSAMSTVQALAEFGSARWRFVEAGAISTIAAAMIEQNECIALVSAGSRVLFCLADVAVPISDADRVVRELRTVLPGLPLPTGAADMLLARAVFRQGLACREGATNGGWST
eukprot:gnl/TRDRNA2_/TRDRNA2_197850_c0_seq1.p1 gnl/TRDRNA2_/TRDRNA2_197850_c0~~gnl/TRDRNA2_/TRDRNA2_197850_c0_seq1.p1  ORF type:complete len:292 (+),score=38.24 gnl/TRDRNA2_/TRDRNA2_197850_c0_seq1:102-977(+)